MSLTLANASLGNHHTVLEGHSSLIWSVAFSQSYPLILASASFDKTIRLWNAETGAGITTLKGHSDVVYSIAFSPDGVMLASSSLDRTIKLWGIKAGTEIRTIPEGSGAIYSIAFSPNGACLVSGSANGTICLWDVKSGSNISTLNNDQSSVFAVALSPDGERIASVGDKTIKLWDIASRTAVAMLDGHSNSVTSVEFSPGGEHLASGSFDKTIRLWDAVTGAQIAKLEGHSNSIRSVTFSPNGKLLASGSVGTTIRLWDVASLSQISTLKGHSRDVNCVAFSFDGALLASGSDDRTIRIWNVPQELRGAQASPLTSSSAGWIHSTADNQQDTVTLASTSIPPTNEDTATPISTPVPLNNDITGSVSLEDNTPIAYGGFGDLFMGIHVNHGKVALKKPRRLLSEALIRRFLREVNLWCSVSHPHVLPCLGMCKIGVDVYVVSPFIENGDLLSCMGRGQVLNRSKLLFEVAEALTHLHHKGIVHGDVKAQNILLSDDGSALLCDFGLAKAFDTMATSTEAKGAGSVRWMAPELFLDESRSMASDVYSLGITIAEVLSGRAPYPNISESFAVMLHVAYHDGRPAMEPLSSLEGKSYGTLWKTAEKCWVKDPKARPYMAEVLGMLFPLTREKN